MWAAVRLGERRRWSLPGMARSSRRSTDDPHRQRLTGAAPLAVLGRSGIAVNEGKTYRLEFTHFNASPPMITAQSTGDIDLAGLAYSSFALAVENAKLTDLRVIADVFQDGVEGYFSTQYMVLNDSGIKAVEDIKGKIVTTNAGGSAVDMALRQMLKNHGLLEKRDYTLVEFMSAKHEIRTGEP